MKVGLKHLGMALAALAAATPAQAEWREATSKHFVIYSEDSEKSVREFATRLERFDAALRASSLDEFRAVVLRQA